MKRLMKCLMTATCGLAAVLSSAPAASAAGQPVRAALLEPPPAAVAPRSEVAGIRIVPAILAHTLYLRPTAVGLRAGGIWANADARVYTDRAGAIIGLTLSAWGLPDAPRFGESSAGYWVWLGGRGRTPLRLGELESKNASQATFGYTAHIPLAGFDTVLVTWGSAAPASLVQFSAELPRATTLPY